MTEFIQKKLSDSPAARWTALVLLAGAMFFGYIFMDILSPLQELLATSKGWTPDAYGSYAGSETFLNVFVFFLIFAGIILDKMGVRFTAILSGVVMVCGGLINWYAVSNAFEGSAAQSFMDNFMNLPLKWWNITPFYDGMPASAKLSAIGFMCFGCGVEMAGITVSRGIVKWFKGKEMALAMGVEMAIARIGVAVVVLGSPLLANRIQPVSVSRPVLVAVLLLCIGLISFIAYAFMDKKLENQMGESGEEKELTMVFSWPVKQPIRCYEERLRPDETLVTKIRCIDTFLPVAKGGTFCVPGPFGAGKTVLQHMEAKNADVDIVIVAACGERAGEVVEVLKEFREKASAVGVKQFVIQTHFQSPLEVTPEAREAIRKILSAGWLITNQLVYTVAASRRGHTTRLRQVLNSLGVVCYYTFSVKGFGENYTVFTPNSRSMQEQQEEKLFGRMTAEQTAELDAALTGEGDTAGRIRRFMKKHRLPFLATDRSVLNLPAIGKSMTFRLVGITAEGKRILRFDHDRTRRHSPIIDRMGEIYIVENKSVAAYLRQLEKMGEDAEDYASIWGYTHGQTEPRFGLYVYPDFPFGVTDRVSNLELE